MTIIPAREQKIRVDDGETKIKRGKIMSKLISIKILIEDDGFYYIQEDREDGLHGQTLDHPADVVVVIENILAKHEATLSK